MASAAAVFALAATSDWSIMRASASVDAAESSALRACSMSSVSVAVFQELRGLQRGERVGSDALVLAGGDLRVALAAEEVSATDLARAMACSGFSSPTSLLSARPGSPSRRRRARCPTPRTRRPPLCGPRRTIASGSSSTRAALSPVTTSASGRRPGIPARRGVRRGDPEKSVRLERLILGRLRPDDGGPRGSRSSTDATSYEREADLRGEAIEFLSLRLRVRELRSDRLGGGLGVQRGLLREPGACAARRSGARSPPGRTQPGALGEGRAPPATRPRRGRRRPPRPGRARRARRPPRRASRGSASAAHLSTETREKWRRCDFGERKRQRARRTSRASGVWRRSLAPTAATRGIRRNLSARVSVARAYLRSGARCARCV